MKLAILAQSYLFDETVSVNGSLVQLYNLAQGFYQNDVEVYYICTTKDRSKADFEVREGIHFHWIQLQTGLFEWKRIMPIYNNILKTIAPDALYVRGRNVLQYVAGKYAKKHNVTYVWGTNGDDSAEFNKNIKRLKESNKSLLKTILLYPLKAYEDCYINNGMKMPNYIINQNKHQQEETLKHLKQEGFVFNSYYYINDSKEISTKNQVLWLARWSKEKQPELFIEMISQIKQPDVDFTMAGGSSDSQDTKELIDKANKNNIKTPGKIDYKNVNGYFAKSLVFVNTSYREGVSNTFIEAMLNGVPVLSLNSNPNNWLSDYNIGYCANGNLEQLTKVLNDLLIDREKLKKMSEDAKSFAKQQFSNDDIIESYIKLFNKNA
ncbi:MAG: glycosyltransferase involved in cell wall biosynthesis [Polaribacter sp.]|jgi:glycosyltransferase involved in cell wall biosynthesis